MPRTLFETQLDTLRRDVVTLGSLVESSIAKSIYALQARDESLAQVVIDGDRAIDQLRYRLEEACLVLFATQQPVASDLRWITAALIISNELERVGDYAKGIARISQRINQEPLLKPLIDIPRMASLCQEQLRGGLAAYTNRDVTSATRVITNDRQIDQLNAQVLRELLSFMIEDPRTITRATYLLWIAHNLERIGDRATNIAERVIFAVSGTWPDTSDPHRTE